MFYLLMLAAAGLLGYEVLRKKSPDETGAALEDLAAQVCSLGPRGEWALQGDVAKQIARELSQMTWTSPEAGDITLVELHRNLTNAAVPADKSALGWATRQNQTKSIMAMVIMTKPTSALQKLYLRAVDPGKEGQYGGNGGGGGFAVMAYAQAIPKNQPLPGSPLKNVLGEVAPPAGDEAILTTELPANLAGGAVDILKNGANAAAVRAYGQKLIAEGYPKSGAVLIARAAELDKIGPPASANVQAPTAPGVAPVPGTPSVKPGTPGPGSYRVTSNAATTTPGLNVRNDPSTKGSYRAGPTWGSTVQVVGFNAAGTWAQLGAPWNGWVCYACPEGGAGGPFLTPA